MNITTRDKEDFTIILSLECKQVETVSYYSQWSVDVSSKLSLSVGLLLDCTTACMLGNITEALREYIVIS